VGGKVLERCPRRGVIKVSLGSGIAMRESGGYLKNVVWYREGRDVYNLSARNLA